MPRKNPTDFYALERSDDPSKKWQVRVPTSGGGGRLVRFGATGYEDYTIHKDKARRENYRSRHRNDNLDDPLSPGFWSWWALWGDSSNLKTAFADAVRRAKKAGHAVRKNPLVLADYRSYCDDIADLYDDLPEFDEEEAWRWDVLIEHIERFYDKMRRQVDVEFVDGQPYDDAEQMREEVNDTGVLLISKEANDHPVWTPMQNLKFRAVHDYVVHILPGDRGPDFSRRGEMRAYNLHRKLVPHDAVPALFTEVAGQACYANARGEFPVQKIAVFDGVDFYNVGEIGGKKVTRRFEGEDLEMVPRKNPSPPTPSEVAAVLQELQVPKPLRGQFFMGFEVEWEHADTVGYDLTTIGRIVLDHLDEDPRYYSRRR